MEPLQQQGITRSMPMVKATPIFLKSEEYQVKHHLHCKGKLGTSSHPSMPMSCTSCSGFLILTVTYWEAAFSSKSSSPSVTRPLSNVWQFACVAESDVNQSFSPSMTDQSEGKRLKNWFNFLIRFCLLFLIFGFDFEYLALLC